MDIHGSSYILARIAVRTSTDSSTREIKHVALRTKGGIEGTTNFQPYEFTEYTAMKLDFRVFRRCYLFRRETANNRFRQHKQHSLDAYDSFITGTKHFFQV